MSLIKKFLGSIIIVLVSTSLVLAEPLAPDHEEHGKPFVVEKCITEGKYYGSEELSTLVALSFTAILRMEKRFTELQREVFWVKEGIEVGVERVIGILGFQVGNIAMKFGPYYRVSETENEKTYWIPVDAVNCYGRGYKGNQVNKYDEVSY